jgi:hypothetical protein
MLPMFNGVPLVYPNPATRRRENVSPAREAMNWI